MKRIVSLCTGYLLTSRTCHAAGRGWSYSGNAHPLSAVVLIAILAVLAVIAIAAKLRNR